MHVIATAGHVDHGKSTLVRALTGMEPDRFAEERRRGMTIDLGYAWTTLASGDQLAFVDVPGHQRFIANMLAGLGPAPGVLFVVAADEGWSRQSAEHLAAIDALQLRYGLLAVTRSDLADPARTTAESLDRIGQSSLGTVDAVTCSGTTGAGLDDLRAALERLVGTIPIPDPDERVRLWLDRSFTVQGSGTVVTGTLAAGSISAGDELELDGSVVTVRGLQTLNLRTPHVLAPARVALNLRGVPRTDVGRGEVLTTPAAWHHTRCFDARLDTDARLPAQLVLHLGTAALPAYVRPLQAGLVRITVDRDVPLQHGDRAVLRDPGRQIVAAGVYVLDPEPPPLRRRGAAKVRAAELRVRGDAPDPVAEVRQRGAVRRDHLIRLGIPVAALEATDGWLVDEHTWQTWSAGARRAVQQWATLRPLEPHMPATALVRALELPDRALLPHVLAAAGLDATDGLVHGAPVADLGPAEAGVRALELRLAETPFRAPESAELAELGLGRRELAAARAADRLLILDGEVVLLPSATERAVAALRDLPEPFTTGAARQALATTRRVAVPLLEHLDALGLTERTDSTTRRVL